MAAGDLTGPGSSLSIDELVALGDEIAALARVGIPLEAGLAQLGSESSGGLRRRLGAVAESLARGEPIDRALADPQVGFSALAQGVVAAGVRSNRLPQALEGLVNSARLRAELRRLTGLALVYPLSLVLVGYAAIVLNLFAVAPRMVDSFYEIHAQPPFWLLQLERIRGLPLWLWSVPPVVAVVLVAWWWIVTGRARSVEPAWSQRLLGAIPGVRRLLRDSDAAAFADLTALLLESGTPLDEAVRLAGRASSNRKVSTAAEELAGELQRGESLSSATAASALPPLLSWLMTVGEARGELSGSLRQAAQHYADQARRRADLLEVMLPLGVVLFVGGTAVLTSALLLFVPWFVLLKQIAEAAYK